MLQRAASQTELARGRVAIFADAAWNIHNFRRPIISALIENGYDVVAMAPKDRFAEVLPCPFYPLPLSARGKNQVEDAVLLGRTIRALRETRPSVLLNFTIKPNVYGTLAARALGIPAINNISGLGTAFIDSSATSLLARSIYRFSQSCAEHIFFQNEDDRDLFLMGSSVPRERTSRIPGSGIDTDWFAPREKTRKNERFVFLLVARLIGDKGIREYAEAARLLRDAGVNAEFQVLGPKAAEKDGGIPRSELKGWIESGIVRHLGEARDVRPHIASADCVVLPSYREGLPRTLLEAASMAKPVIATDVPGCRDVVVDGEMGLLCRAQDSDDLADAMQRVVQMDEWARDKMGRAGRRHVLKSFHPDRVVRAYLSKIAKIQETPN